MPTFGKLNILSAKAAIRDLFIENIIAAKGLDKAAKLMDMEIIPTPLAVFEACELLSAGTKSEKGLGEIMAYDLGGATCDVYSMAEGNPQTPNTFISGIKEPFAKRTVEGDVGMRYSLEPLYDLILEENSDFPKKDITDWLEICKKNPDAVPKESYEKYADTDATFAAHAVRISAARHAGRFERIFTPAGEMLSQEGKDLTQVTYVIGSGGAIINAKNPATAGKIMQEAIYAPQDLNSLKPLNPKILIDEANALAAMGLLARRHPDTALKILINTLKAL
jgi:uncharacterized protein (TIGR01319 family)